MGRLLIILYRKDSGLFRFQYTTVFPGNSAAFIVVLRENIRINYIKL